VLCPAGQFAPAGSASCTADGASEQQVFAVLTARGGVHREEAHSLCEAAGMELARVLTTTDDRRLRAAAAAAEKQHTAARLAEEEAAGGGVGGDAPQVVLLHQFPVWTGAECERTTGVWAYPDGSTAPAAAAPACTASTGHPFGCVLDPLAVAVYGDGDASHFDACWDELAYPACSSYTGCPALLAAFDWLEGSGGRFTPAQADGAARFRLIPSVWDDASSTIVFIKGHDTGGGLLQVGAGDAMGWAADDSSGSQSLLFRLSRPLSELQFGDAVSIQSVGTGRFLSKWTADFSASVPDEFLLVNPDAAAGGVGAGYFAGEPVGLQRMCPVA
jgi:hypothetical protein